MSDALRARLEKEVVAAMFLDGDKARGMALSNLVLAHRKEAARESRSDAAEWLRARASQKRRAGDSTWTELVKAADDLESDEG